MNTCKALVLALAWIVSLVGVGLLAQETRPALVVVGQAPGVVISGDNIGFRVHPQAAGQPVEGTLVVKISGQWVDAKFAPKVSMAK